MSGTEIWLDFYSILWALFSVSQNWFPFCRLIKKDPFIPLTSSVNLIFYIFLSLCTTTARSHLQRFSTHYGAILQTWKTLNSVLFMIKVKGHTQYLCLRITVLVYVLKALCKIPPISRPLTLFHYGRLGDEPFCLEWALALWRSGNLHVDYLALWHQWTKYKCSHCILSFLWPLHNHTSFPLTKHIWRSRKEITDGSEASMTYQSFSGSAQRQWRNVSSNS